MPNDSSSNTENNTLGMVNAHPERRTETADDGINRETVMENLTPILHVAQRSYDDGHSKEQAAKQAVDSVYADDVLTDHPWQSLTTSEKCSVIYHLSKWLELEFDQRPSAAAELPLRPWSEQDKENIHTIFQRVLQEGLLTLHTES